jgi:predicted Zn-dependent protease
MEKVLFILAFTISTLGMSQSNYEQGMQKAFQLWGEGNSAEASALFERIASAEKDNWLPGYYVALVNTTNAFSTQDAKTAESQLTKAQNALNPLLVNHPNNAELLVMQAMIHTAYIAKDPMTKGQRLSGQVMQLYGKAEAIDPNNPRVVLNKAQFEMGSAQFFGTDIKPICAQLKKAIQLFDTFKPETPFHPNWGKDQAEQTLRGCL